MLSRRTYHGIFDSACFMSLRQLQILTIVVSLGKKSFCTIFCTQTPRKLPWGLQSYGIVHKVDFLHCHPCDAGVDAPPQKGRYRSDHPHGRHVSFSGMCSVAIGNRRPAGRRSGGIGPRPSCSHKQSRRCGSPPGRRVLRSGVCACHSRSRC